MDDFINQALIHNSTDYSDKKSVYKANRAADKMREIAKSVCCEEEVKKFIESLNHPVAGKWIAFTFADNPILTSSQKAKCVKKIRTIASGNDADAIGAEMWLSERGL
ncbi:hypothetical protein [Thalassotalea mangrovi]|uniref:Uncharacterized protein n=1 Tax=Thalassotalea mangrovi TaxID=2572245 RepID=A0A4V5NUB6_9GAMM|nr:hypothetical protein [Thalassotalea mangrovi]TKB45782.1 hypothetical protein E8M12_06955 [Thalassotalea mangrovi]